MEPAKGSPPRVAPGSLLLNVQDGRKRRDGKSFQSRPTNAESLRQPARELPQHRRPGGRSGGRHKRKVSSDLIFTLRAKSTKAPSFLPSVSHPRQHHRDPIRRTLCRKRSIGQREHPVLRLPAESNRRRRSARELCHPALSPLSEHFTTFISSARQHSASGSAHRPESRPPDLPERIRRS